MRNVTMSHCFCRQNNTARSVKKNVILKTFLLRALCCSVLGLLLLAPCHVNAADFALPQVETVSTYPFEGVTLFFPSAMEGQGNACLSRITPLYTVRTKQSLTFSPLPGRGGAQAINALLRKNNSGHALALFSLPELFWHTEQPAPLYEADEIHPLLMLAQAPLALWVAETSPYTTLPDLVSAIQEMPYGAAYIAGNGSHTLQHLATRMLNRESGVYTEFLPQADVAAARNSVLAGTAMACWGLALSQETMPGMRPIAITAEERSHALPNVPLFMEYEYAIILTQQFGLALRASTPEGTQHHATAFWQKLVQDPDFIAVMNAKGFTSLDRLPAELPRYLEQQQAIAHHLRDAYSENP